MLASMNSYKGTASKSKNQTAAVPVSLSLRMSVEGP